MPFEYQKTSRELANTAQKHFIFHTFSYGKPPKTLILHGFFLHRASISAILKQFEKKDNYFINEKWRHSTNLP